MADAVAKTKPKSKAKAKAMGPNGLPWHIEVDVYLERAGDDPLFRMHSTMPTNPRTLSHLKNNNRPGTSSIFNLIDETNSGFFFPTHRRRSQQLARVGTRAHKRR